MPRYFTAVALAIVETALYNLTRDGQRVLLVNFADMQAANSSIGLEDAPTPLRGLVSELLRLGEVVRELQDRDDQSAIDRAIDDEDDLRSLTLIELLRQELEAGADAHPNCESGSMYEIGTIANSVNRMAIGKKQGLQLS